MERLITYEYLVQEPSLPEKVGLYIGSFNLFHEGHFEMAEKALDYLDMVWFYPVGTHSGKDLLPMEERIKGIMHCIYQNPNLNLGITYLESGGVVNPGPGWPAVFLKLTALLPSSKLYLVRGADKICGPNYRDPNSERYTFLHAIGMVYGKEGFDMEVFKDRVGNFKVDCLILNGQKNGHLSSNKLMEEK